MAKKREKISKILVANRGEIAVRIIRAARDLGIKTVAIFSEADQGSLPVRLADERVLLKGSSATQTYLNYDKIIFSALETNADAIHPGYGFLSENSEFAKKVEDQGLIFIGPTSEAIFAMGDKLRAREYAIRSGVPVLPGMEYKNNLSEIKEFINKISYPVIIKASAGGSGRGIRVCESELALKDNLEDASKEAISAFGSGIVYVEKYLRTPRHIEVQIASDKYGNHFHVFERECSLQRRRQKLIEEAPAPKLNKVIVEKIRNCSTLLAKEVNYSNVGTLEFLVDGGYSAQDQFYFLEMNTRLQVEHTVTEEVTGIDLCKLQIQIAEGGKLSSDNFPKETRGHAMQFRLYAEDPVIDFRPSLGVVTNCHLPSGPGIRIDSHLEKGMNISPYYDALLAKVIVYGETREVVLSRAKRAFDETKIEGVKTNIDFFRWVLEQKDFIESNIHINWLQDNWKPENLPLPSLFVNPNF